MKTTLYLRMKNKAHQSLSKHHVVAVGFNAKGEVLGITMNRPAWNRFIRKTHAECLLIDRYGSNLTKIVIARFNNSGNALPIDPCPMCKAYADSFGIKIEPIN